MNAQERFNDYAQRADDTMAAAKKMSVQRSVDHGAASITTSRHKETGEAVVNTIAAAQVYATLAAAWSVLAADEISRGEVDPWIQPDPKPTMEEIAEAAATAPRL